MKTGYFGKLPGYGDFIHRNVSPEIMNRWDEWVMSGVEASRVHFGDSWRDTYFTSPIWQFYCQEGLLSDSLVAGLMMPSIDASGRCYPFTVFIECPNAFNPLILMKQLASLQLDCEDFLLSLLERERPDLDDIAEQINKIYLNCNLSDESIHTELISAKGNQIIGYAVTELSQDNYFSESFINKLVVSQEQKLSVWLTHGRVDEQAVCRYFSGLPSNDSFEVLLGGLNVNG